MTKQTKILIGLGVVGVAGYLYWKSMHKKANLTSAKRFITPIECRDGTTSSTCPTCTPPIDSFGACKGHGGPKNTISNF
jgi:hypothetical protein